MHRNAPQAPAIDAVAISTFCEVVFGYLDGFVPVRLLAESGTPDQRPWQSFPGVDDVAHALIREAKTAVDVGRGVFVVPGTVARPGSAKARDIIETGAVLLDLDEGDVEVVLDGRHKTELLKAAVQADFPSEWEAQRALSLTCDSAS